MTSRETALGQIEVGDIFNAEDAAGPVRTCLTISVAETTILARSITTQEIIEIIRKQKLMTMREDGILKALAGLVAIEEVLLETEEL